MTVTEFSEILAHYETQSLTQSKTNLLVDVIDKHPYFQAARALQLKGLKQNHHFSYNAELKKVAAYTADRRILFDYITSSQFNQHTISAEIKERNTESKKENTLDKVLEMNLREANRVLDPNLFENSKEVKESSTSTSEKTQKDSLPKNQKPLEFSKNEAHSFTEWLKLTNAKKIVRESDSPKEEKSSKNLSKKFKLIDNFIANNPKIAPAKDHKPSEVKLVNKSPSNQLMTETLAKIYLEQKNYSKAIQAYKILILKNPEKSGLFADQIREIEKIQVNKNS